MALTIVRAKSLLMRSSALMSCPKKAAASLAVAPLCAAYSSSSATSLELLHHDTDERTFPHDHLLDGLAGDVGLDRGIGQGPLAKVVLGRRRRSRDPCPHLPAYLDGYDHLFGLGHLRIE